MHPRASAEQRGTAAHARQLDENSGRQILNQGERKFVNTVIHDPNTKHRREFDKRLENIAAKTSHPGKK